MKKIIIAVFMLVLFAPLLAMELGITKVANYEHRILASRPTGLDPYGYEEYLKDNLGFKNQLVQLDSGYKALFRSSASQKVVLGEDGWLFYTDPDFAEWDPIRMYMGLSRFNEAELKTLTAKLVSFDDKMKAEGITFYLMIPPNKHTVYSEGLPRSIRDAKGESTMEQLVKHLQATTDIKIIDVTTPLIAAKDEAQLYYKTDTHWNSYGAYVAHGEIMRELGMLPSEIDEFDVISTEKSGMDLARMQGTVGLGDLEYSFSYKGAQGELVEGEFDTEKTAVYTGEEEGASVMMYHDSYQHALLPFLAPRFSRTITKWKLAPDSDEVISYKPDYVIFSLLERNLHYMFQEECLR